jgi:hypothetical protein
MISGAIGMRSVPDVLSSLMLTEEVRPNRPPMLLQIANAHSRDTVIGVKYFSRWGQLLVPPDWDKDFWGMLSYHPVAGVAL